MVTFTIILTIFHFCDKDTNTLHPLWDGFICVVDSALDLLLFILLLLLLPSGPPDKATDSRKCALTAKLRLFDVLTLWGMSCEIEEDAECGVRD